ncbi:MAG: hypothetical protein EOP09_01490 [Proteobacteria bacterium]|nr:MAG: hypothetical protein EOP09_01490 [Pseudomonadota bacterium]
MKTTCPKLFALMITVTSISGASLAQANCSDHYKLIPTSSRGYTQALIKGAWNSVKLDKVSGRQIKILRHVKKKAFKRKQTKHLHLDISDTDFANLIADMDQKNQLCNGSRIMQYAQAIDAVAERLQTEVYSGGSRGTTGGNSGCFPQNGNVTQAYPQSSGGCF